MGQRIAFHLQLVDHLWQNRLAVPVSHNRFAWCASNLANRARPSSNNPVSESNSVFSLVTRLVERSDEILALFDKFCNGSPLVPSFLDGIDFSSFEIAQRVQSSLESFHLGDCLGLVGVWVGTVMADFGQTDFGQPSLASPFW